MESHKIFFMATLMFWLYTVTKNHMKKHQKEYRQFLTEIDPKVFKRPLLTHRIAITTERVGKGLVECLRDNTKARKLILEEDL